MHKVADSSRNFFVGFLLSCAHPSLGAQEAPPDAELWNPADLVNQFTLFAHPLLFIPHGAIIGHPMRIHSRARERRTQ